MQPPAASAPPSLGMPLSFGAPSAPSCDAPPSFGGLASAPPSLAVVDPPPPHAARSTTPLQRKSRESIRRMKLPPRRVEKQAAACDRKNYFSRIRSTEAFARSFSL